MISNRTRAILTLAGVFLLGAIAGGGMLHLYIRGQIRDAQSMNDPGSFRGFIEDRLRLTEAQRYSLRDELGATYEDLAALRHASAEEYGELIDTFSTRVAPQLDADQRQLLGRLEERMRRRLSRGAVRVESRPGIVDSLDMPPPSSRNQPSGSNVAIDTGRAQISPVDPRAAAEPQRKIPEPKIFQRPDASAGDSSAQASREGDPREEKLDRALSNLPDADSLRGRFSLTSEQIGGIRQIVRETRQKTRAELRKLAGFRRLQKEAVRRNLREMDQQIEALLDEPQRAEYRIYRRELIDRMRSGRGMGRGPRENRP